MRHCITVFTPEDKELIWKLRSAGFHVYCLRDAEGASFTIEPRVVCNNIGHIVTDFDLKARAPHIIIEGGYESWWMDDEEFDKLGSVEVPLAQFKKEAGV